MVELIRTAQWIGLPATVVGELWAGFLRGSRAAENERQLHDFVNSSIVEVISIDEAIARAYGEIVLELRRVGRPLPTNDIWIAATAADVGATVLTYDDHFRHISRVGTIVL